MLRDFPAYARTVAQMRARGHRPICVAVLLATRWDCYEHVPKICIRPRDWARRRYNFDMVRELHAVAVAGEDCEPAQFGELVLELMLAAPSKLWAYDVTGRELAADDYARGLGYWAARQAGLPAADPLVKSAIRRLETGIAEAARATVHQAETIDRRSGLEASVRFQLSQWETEDRVRELMRAPFLEGAA